MKLILMGAPGCGKGTQSPFLKERYTLCHLSTGDMLRDAVANKTASGIKAKEAMDAGKLVSDDIVFGVLKEQMAKPECSNGYILDGLPRTLEQAKKLTEMGEKPTKVFSFDVPDDVIIQRTSGRWLHRASGRTYHEVFNPPKSKGVDDLTGEPLMQRADDKKEVVTKRLQVYHKEIDPVEGYYNSMGVLQRLNGNRKIEEVRETLVAALDPIHEKKKKGLFW